MARLIIDGERKALLVRVGTSFRFDGLLRRSEWESRKAQPGTLIVTQRCLNGAALHVQGLKGQYPSVGTLIPAALFAHRSGRKTTGKAMDQHLAAIAAQRKAEREYARILQNARKVVL